MTKIDFEKRMTFDEHMQLFFYDRIKNGTQCTYDEWRITESLIDSYNKEMDVSVAGSIERCLVENRAFVEQLRNRPLWEFEKPVIWNDRIRSDYYIENLEDSHKFEVYAEHVFKNYDLDIGLFYGKSQQYDVGETRAGIEIKCDKRSEETGNYYIEYQERLNNGGEWVNSGILKHDNTKYYFYGVVDHYVIFPRRSLMEYYDKIVVRNIRFNGCRKVQIDTSKGFVIPKSEAEKIRMFPSVVARKIKASNRTFR